MLSSKQSLKSIPEVIANIDLSMVRVKLADSEEGEGWDPSYCITIEKEYKKFLTLTYYYTLDTIVPSKIVDKFWHYHILDTKAYHKDCLHIFGGYLHHYPYFGMRDDEDKQDLEDSYKKTLKFYKESFGNIPEDVWGLDNPSQCPNCGRRCRSDSLNSKRIPNA